MDNNIINTINNNQGGVVKVSHEAVSYYADLAKKWAVKTDTKVDGSEYSAKYYATEAKKQIDSLQNTIDSAEELVNSIETTKTEISELKENSISDIQNAKTDSIANLDAEKEKVIKEIQGLSNIKIATTEAAGLVKPDGKTITIDAEGVLSALLSGGSGDSFIEDVNIKFYTDEEGTEYQTNFKSGMGKSSKPMVRGYILFKNNFTVKFGKDVVEPTAADDHRLIWYDQDKIQDWLKYQTKKVLVIPSVAQEWTDISEPPEEKYTAYFGQYEGYPSAYYITNANKGNVIVNWIAVGTIRGEE